MIVKMLSRDTDNSLVQSSSRRSIRKCYLLFPTIEKMAESPNGRFFAPMLKYFRWAIPLLIFPFQFLPHRVKHFLIVRYFGKGQVPQCAVKATVKLLSPSSCRNCLHLANIEMRSVCELDRKTVDENLTRLCFYYGKKDAWCPVEYFYLMVRRFPSAEIHFCSCGFEHAFVMRSSEQMASIVSHWLQSSN